MVFEHERTGTWHAYGKATPSQARSPFDFQSFREQHQVAWGKPAPLGKTSLFADYVCTHFPEVAMRMDEMDFGVLHLEVGALKLVTRDAILRRDWPTVRTHFDLVDSVLETADSALHDAIGVSYLGNLFFGELSLNYAKARTLLPTRLGLALEIMERHYEDLSFRWRAA